MQHSLCDRFGSSLNWKFLPKLDNREDQYSLLMVMGRLTARGVLQILCEWLHRARSAAEGQSATEMDSSCLHL